MKRTAFITVFFVVSMCIVVQAQPPVQNSTRPETPQNDSDIRDFMAWKLVDYLRLSEEQSAKMFPLWSEYSRGRGRLAAERRALYRKIGSAIEEESASREDLLRYVEELKAMEDKEVRHREEFRESTRDILDDIQFVKLFIFEYRLLDEFLGDFNRRGGEMRNR